VFGTRWLARVVIPVQVEDGGKSEGLSVMEGIRDETIALTRKRADFHLVILREEGLFNRKPEGVDAKIPARG
jgi:hypothetical protein